MKLLKMITSQKTLRGQIRKTRFLVYVALCLISQNETVFICHSCEMCISLNIPEKQNNPQVQSAYLHIGGVLKSCHLGLPMWQSSPSVFCPHRCISKPLGTKNCEMPDILSSAFEPLNYPQPAQLTYSSTCTFFHLCLYLGVTPGFVFVVAAVFFLCLHFFN